MEGLADAIDDIYGEMDGGIWAALKELKEGLDDLTEDVGCLQAEFDNHYHTETGNGSGSGKPMLPDNSGGSGWVWPEPDAEE